jgi:2-dehydro-3-deoxyphosphogluconate aldolase/(4S)-4-hydroxy-2-oxoglutarate aldolase
MNCFSWETFQTLPLIGILRGFERSLLPGILRACIAGGLTSIEVTMNSPGAAEQIREAVDLAAGRLNIGAGTVLDLGLVEAALAAGASFIVTPGLHEAVLRACLTRRVPVFPGVFTPTEIAAALILGVRWVKVFPAETLRSSYFRNVTETFADARLLPTGGVTLETIPALVDAGAAGFGVGSPLFAPDRIRRHDWAWLEQRCRSFARTYAEAVRLRTLAANTSPWDQHLGSVNVAVPAPSNINVRGSFVEDPGRKA